jgi:hypothetical protein
MNQSWLKPQPGAQSLLDFCGKEVAVFKPDGTQYINPAGPFILWDTCLAAATDLIIDMAGMSITLENSKFWSD